jgi:hypothetical protein
MIKRKQSTTRPAKADHPELLVDSQLTSDEERDLFRIESRIASGLSAFFDVAYALMQIKERRLYRGEFTSFEEYCRVRWEMQCAYAYRLIGAAEICKHLSPIGDTPLPENECQVRPLAGLPPKTIEKAWKRACEKAGPEGRITGALVQKAVKDVIRKHPSLKKSLEEEDWQTRIAPLLQEALRCTKKGDKDRLSEMIDRISLLLLVGRRRHESDEDSSA